MCTRLFWNAPAVAKVTARTCDWEVSDEPRLWYFPAGLARDGACAGAAQWETRYRVLATSFWGVATSEAVNEAGLAAHLLYLAASDYGPRDGRPGVDITRWAQYVVDRFATVEEALAGLEEVQTVQTPLRGQTLGVHLAIEDASGDSAIVEMLDGRPVVHHGPEYTVMANDPSFDEQLAGLARYRPFGGTEAIPGDILSEQRFVRATYYLGFLPEPADEREAVAGALGVARNVSVPFGAPYDDFSVYPTWWASVTDVTHGVYYFQSTLAPNVVWADLGAAELVGADDVRSVDPTDPDLVGDVSAALAPTAAPF